MGIFSRKHEPPQYVTVMGQQVQVPDSLVRLKRKLFYEPGETRMPYDRADLEEIEVRGQDMRADAVESVYWHAMMQGNDKPLAALALEPDNAHDPNAVRVIVGGLLIGYVAAHQAEAVGRWVKTVGNSAFAGGLARLHSFRVFVPVGVLNPRSD